MIPSLLKWGSPWGEGHHPGSPVAASRWPRPALLRRVQGFRNPFWPKWFLVAGDVYRVSGDTSDARHVCECVGGEDSRPFQ